MGDSILKLEYTTIKEGKSFIGLILQSKRSIKNKRIDKLEKEAYIDNLLREIQNNNSMIDWHYIFITDADKILTNIEEKYVHCVTKNEHKEFYGIYRAQLRILRGFCQEDNTSYIEHSKRDSQ